MNCGEPNDGRDATDSKGDSSGQNFYAINLTQSTNPIIEANNANKETAEEKKSKKLQESLDDGSLVKSQKQQQQLKFKNSRDNSIISNPKNSIDSYDQDSLDLDYHHYNHHCHHHDGDELNVSRAKTKNVDSGYAWVILAIMFMLNSTTCGIGRVYGLIFAEQVQVGYYNREQASWPISTASTVENLAGLLTPALGQHLSWAQIELIGTLMFVISNFGAWLSDALWSDIIWLGVVQGFALSINTILGMAINNEYFERYRTTAYGITISGGTCGIFFLAPIIGWVLDTYKDFRTAYLSIGIIMSFNLILCLFIKPRNRCAVASKQVVSSAPPATTATTTISAQQNNTNSNTIKEIPSDQLSLDMESNNERGPSSLSGDSQENQQQQIDCLECKRNDQAKQRISQQKKGSIASEWSSLGLGPDGTLNRGRRAFLRTLSMKLEDKDQQVSTILYKCTISRQSTLGRSVKNGLVRSISIMSKSSSDGKQPDSQVDGSISPLATGKRHHQGGRPAPIRASTMPEGAPNQFSGDQNDHHHCDDDRQTEMTTIKTTNININNNNNNSSSNKKITNFNREQEQQQVTDDGTEKDLDLDTVISLLKNPYLHVIWVMLVTYYYIARIFIIILVDFAQDHGFDQDQSRGLLNYWSYGEIVGRILLGGIIDMQWLSIKNYIILTCLLLSGSMILLVAIQHIVNYCIMTTCIASLISLEYMLINVFIIEYLGRNKVTWSYGIGAFVTSILLFFRPMLIGMFRDGMGSYDGLIIFLAGVPFTLALFFCLIEPWLVRFWPKSAILIS